MFKHLPLATLPEVLSNGEVPHDEQELRVTICREYWSPDLTRILLLVLGDLGRRHWLKATPVLGQCVIFAKGTLRQCVIFAYLKRPIPIS